MSWFDPVGLASFAKSALKEAQKTIDKALDIKDDVDGETVSNKVEQKDNHIRDEEIKTKSKQMNDTSIWGSFSGSYFDASSVKSKKSTSTSSSSNATIANGQAPLATPETELTPTDNATGFPSKYTTIQDLQKERDVAEEIDQLEKIASATHVKSDSEPGIKTVTANQIAQDDSATCSEEKVCIRNKTRRNSSNRNSYISNRLSVISTESEGKKSSESVEVLGSLSATTSPDSENPSFSSSMGLPISSPSGTESVEVIDSLASPSSVEVITESDDQCDFTVAPQIASPGYSTDSVEVLGEGDDDVSVADSYTSISESTGTTMFSHLQRMTDSCQDLSQASSRIRSGDSTPDVLRLSLPSHGSCDLLSESIQEVDWESSQSRLSTYNELHESSPVPPRPHSSHGSPIRRLLSKSEERIVSGRLELSRLTKSDVAPSALAGENQSIDSRGLDDSQSDTRTLVTIDSSCEETLVGSSSDEGTPGSTAPGQTTEKLPESTTASSCYMKELLAEAISEEGYTRETSPTLSEKSRSDVVKVGSEQTSGHTSGDELETTTSSDIEIISSPNGDSSSTTSRHSPAKLLTRGKLSLVAVDVLGKTSSSKSKGHNREPSEASSACSDENSEIEKLSKKIADLTEILEAREVKLVELSRFNLELQEKNSSLKKQVEFSNRPQDSQLEKDEIIKELREEGEKLSKLQLKQSNLIKTLRRQEQSHLTTANNTKKQVDTLTQELESTKKRLTAKEELERNQIEKINLLTAKVGRQDQEIATLLDQLEQAVVKAEQLRMSLDTVELELSAKKKAVTILEKELREAIQTGETAAKEKDRLLNIERSALATKDAAIGQLDELRLQLKQTEQIHSQKEAKMREEKKVLLWRLEEAERRSEELAQSVSSSTRPLLKQLDALQISSSQQRESWELRERELLDRLEEGEATIKELRLEDKTLKQELLGLRGKGSGLESQLAAAKQDLQRQQIIGVELQQQVDSLKEEINRVNLSCEKEIEILREQVKSLKSELSASEATIASQRAALQEAAKERSRQSSPALSIGRASFSESMSSANWHQFGDEAFETASVTGRYGNVYDSVRVGSSTLLEGLQAQLKMRDGEAAQLQWELQRRDAERAALTSELAALSSKVTEQEETIAKTEELAATLESLQRNYDALLQMHGEKVEEVEELRLDLEDVKEMYKAQIDQLLLRTNGRSDPPG